MMLSGQPPAAPADPAPAPSSGDVPRPRGTAGLPTALLVFGLGIALMLSTLQGGGGGVLASVFEGDGLLGGLNAARQEVTGTGIRLDDDIITIIVSVANAAIPYAGIATFVAFVSAGFLFILGFGSDSTVQRAKNVMIWSAVGFIVVIVSFVVTQFVYDLLTS